MFDAHFHVIDPRFPLVPNQGYLPEPFTVDDYRARLTADGGTVVSGSFQAYDQTYLIDALQRLGPTFVGVAQVPPDISDEEVLRLTDAGVRAFRANFARGTAPPDLLNLARRFEALAGWHLEIYGDARELPPLPGVRLVLDHLGGPEAALPATLRLVEQGARVKATRFGVSDHDIARTLREIVAVNPAALLFGTDLPGTRAPRAFEPRDLELVLEIAGERAIFTNGAETYRLPQSYD
ncbi:amidohydrolase family protein [Solirubrobacter sp. CPCC 204708]|nr:amidohydrolase family protein [Solirubrobacter deserti]